MILKEATIKYKGYNPDDLKPKSQKRVCVICDNCGRVRWQAKAFVKSLCGSCASKLRFSHKDERKLASERQLKRYENNPVSKGKDNPLYGRSLSVTHKQKIGNANKGHEITEETLEKMRGERVERIEKICPICKHIFFVLPHENDRIYCSQKCVGKSHIGDNNPAKQPGVGAKISVTNTGRRATLETIQKLKDSHKTEGYLEKMGGKNNPAWKGGKTSEKQKFYNSIKYSEWRTSIFERDNYTCQKCKNRGGNLNSHHILPYRNYPEFGLTIDNGITLCVNCHSIIKWNEYPHIPEFLGIIFDNKGKEIFGDI